MLKSRLRWRALAMLGALLSVMIEWQIVFAMPASTTTTITTTTIPTIINKTNAAYNHNNNSSRRSRSGSDSSDASKNCSESSFSVTKCGVNVIDSKLSSNNSLSDINSQQIVSTSTSDENLSTSNNMQKQLYSIHNKRKRKKNLVHVTAATLRNHRTQGVHSESESDCDSDSVLDVTTINPVIDNSTIYNFLSRTDRSVYRTAQRQRKSNSNLDRNERSANLSHISGPARKIQLYIKNRFIQLMPDGMINGTQDDLNDYTILQRTTVDVGQIKIQGVATCLYLCMDQCGSVYGSKAFTDDCVFNESMEQHHYNTYSSTYNSNSRRTLYLALNRHGEPRKLQIPPTRSLGKLATYTKALTETVPQERVEELISKTFGANRVKHGLRQLCDAGRPLIELTAKVMKARPKCNMTANGQAAVSEKLRIISSNSTISNNSHNNNSSISHSHGGNSNKKKKKKRRCRPEETENENCHKSGPLALKKRPHKGKCSIAEDDCTNRRKSNNKKQHHHHHQQHNQQQSKQNGNGNGGGNGNGNKKGKKQNGKKGKSVGGGGGNGGNGGRTTTARSISTTTTASAVPTTTYPTAITTSTEYQTDDETELDDQIPATSGENDEDEDISSLTSIGGQTNLVDSGEELLYDGEFDV